MAHRRRLQAYLAVLATVSALRGSSGEPGAGASEAVAAWLASHVKTLTRPVSTYHYAMRTRIGLPAEGPVPTGFDPSVYLGIKIPRYWDLSLQPHPFSTASGLYVSTDPVIARGFGGSGDVWAMIEVVLQSGFRFVDVRIAGDRLADGEKLPPPIRRVLSAGGCEVQFAQTLVIAQESRNCREIAVHVMRQLHVDGILYNFPAKRLNPCPARPEGAFIVVDSAGVRLDTARVFVAESRAPGRESVHDMFVRAREAGSHLPLPWPDLHGEIDGPQTSAWMKDHIFGCGGYAEDQFLAPDSAPSAESLYRSAKALRDAGNLAASLEAYRAVLAADPILPPHSTTSRGFAQPVPTQPSAIPPKPSCSPHIWSTSHTINFAALPVASTPSCTRFTHLIPSPPLSRPTAS